MYNAYMKRYWYLVLLVLCLSAFSRLFADNDKAITNLLVNPIIKSEILFDSEVLINPAVKFPSGVIDTLFNHDNFTGGVFWYGYDSVHFATRLTVPNQVASQCTVKLIRFLFYRPTATTFAPCSLYIWRDTLINGIHRPGSKIWGRFDTLPGGSGLWMYSLIFSGAPIIFNRNEDFWLGAINFNERGFFCSDASANPDSSRNQRKNWGGTWQSYANDFAFEAGIAYEPRDNNVGITSIQDVEKLMRGNTITAVKTTIKNFGRNTINPGIPVVMNITGPSFFLADTEYTTSTLTQNVTELITFSEDWQVPTITGDYIVSIWTAYELDSIYNNDTFQMNVYVYNSGVRETFANEDFPPAGWLVFDFNNDNMWRRDSFPSGFYTQPAGAIISYDEYPYNPNNDWLVSPRFQATPNDSLVFFYRAASSTRFETLLVRLNTNSLSNDTSSYQIIKRVATNDFNWQRCVIALNAYLSQTDTVSVAFHYPCNNKFYLAIDDILTPELIRSIDVFTRSIESPLLPILAESTYLPRVKFRNNSIDFSSEYLVANMYLKISGDSINYFDSITEQIYHGNYETFSFTPFTPVVSETVEIKVWIYHDEDENHTNDTLSKKVFIAPKFQTIPYSTNFNENWGKYGDNPPFGGWQIVDQGNEPNKLWNTNDWYQDTVRHSNILRKVAKISYSPIENQLDRLISPTLNCSVPGTYTLNYWHWYRDYSALTPDSGLVLVSNNGGQTWNRLVKYSNISDVGARVLDISAIASGHKNVKVCFLYGARDEWWWCVDDFSVSWMMSTPILVYPANGLETLAFAINMSWQPVTGAAHYVLQVAYDSTFLFPIISETLTATSYLCSLPPYQYFWKVKAGAPYGNWSDIRNFTITESPPPVYGWQKIDSIIIPPYGYNVKDGAALTFCLVDSNIYALKGNNTSEFYAYNINRNRWYTQPLIKNDSIKMRKIKKGSTLCAGDSVIYALKGNSNEFWAYLINTDTWIRKQSIPGKAVKGGTGMVYVRNTIDRCGLQGIKDDAVNSPEYLEFTNDMIYLLKGGSKECEFYAYSVSNDSWFRKQNAPTEKYGKIFKDGSSIVYDGNSKIFALKGGSKANELYYYDIDTDIWVVMESDTIPLKHPNFTKKKKVKNGAGLAIIDSTIFAIKGGGCIEFWKYSIHNHTWTGLETIPWLHKKSVPKNGAAITAGLDKIYLLKGNNTSEFWCYTPNFSTGKHFSNQISYHQAATNTPVSTEKIFNNTYSGGIIYPNPCDRTGTIYYSASKPGFLSIKISDVCGRLVKTIENSLIAQGNYRMQVDLRDVSPGVYYVIFEFEGKSNQTKLIIR